MHHKVVLAEFALVGRVCAEFAARLVTVNTSSICALNQNGAASRALGRTGPIHSGNELRLAQLALRAGTPVAAEAVEGAGLAAGLIELACGALVGVPTVGGWVVGIEASNAVTERAGAGSAAWQALRAGPGCRIHKVAIRTGTQALAVKQEVASLAGFTLDGAVEAVITVGDLAGQAGRVTDLDCATGTQLHALVVD